MEPSSLTCPKCHAAIDASWFFCPQCAAVVRERPLDTSVMKQILIYGVSFFLAPFGLAWGIKYLRSKDTRSRIVGTVAIILTITALSMTFATLAYVMQYYSRMLDGLSKGIYTGM